MVTKDMDLVPSGEYMMGSDKGYPEGTPVHRVEVNSFYMDVKPVTNAQYRRFCDETVRIYPASPNWADMPTALRIIPTILL